MESQTLEGTRDRQQSDSTAWLVSGALFVFMSAGVIFTVAPKIDLAVANWFFLTGGVFIGNAPAVELVRNLFKILFVATCVAAVLGLASSHLTKRPWFGMSSARCLFLLSCLVIGPGVVANLALKDQWGRARPSAVIEFGGTKSFSGPLAVSQQCKKNCSFVSGEASSIFMIFFAGVFLFKKRAAPLLVVGLISGSIAGLIRMAQGGHFLSDVIFAGVAMALTAALIYRLFEELVSEFKDVDADWVTQQPPLTGQP